MGKRLADEMIELFDEAEKGMEKDKIYDTRNMQIIWLQFAKDCRSILISEDGGTTWKEPPSVDTGKWHYKGWLFKLK